MHRIRSMFSGSRLSDVAEFFDCRPCNIAHSPAPVGSRRYFDEVEARKYFVESHIPGFADFDHWAGKRVLELGCGIGTETVNFARAGALVTAVDLSSESLKIAMKRAFVYDLNVDFYHDDIETLSTVPRHRYDLIWSFGVIHHTPRPIRALKRIAELADEGTVVRVMVYHRYSTKAAVLTHGRVWRDDLVAYQSETQTGCPVTYTYTRRSVRRLFAAAGLEVTGMRVAHIFPYQVDAYRQYRYVKRWWWRLTPAPVFRWLERRFGWHLLITAKLARP